MTTKQNGGDIVIIETCKGLKDHMIVIDFDHCIMDT